METSDEPLANRDAEVALLGSVLFRPTLLDSMQIDPEFFWYAETQIVARTLVTMWARGQRHIDPIILGEELARTGSLKDAGGSEFLFELSETVPHAAHAESYLKTVTATFEHRQLLESLDFWRTEARRRDADIPHIKERLTKQLTTSAGTCRRNKLEFHDAWEAAFKPRPLRECIIEGMLRRGEVANFIASTKTGKSWFSLLLLFCVMLGRDWLNRRVLKGNVLLIDNELHQETIEHRIAAVRHALEIEPDEDHSRFEYLSCRGDWIALHDLIDGIPFRHPAGTLNLIVIDAKYRLFGNGLEENSNDDQTTFHNLIDQFAKQMDCPVVLVHHSTKGDQAGKSVTDIGSGGGSQSRAVDLHMTIRPHQEPGLAVLEGAVRSFAPIEPITLRWNWPLWSVAEGVEPVLPKNSKDGERIAEMRARIQKYLTTEWQSLAKLAERCSTKKDRNPFADIIDDLQRDGQAELSEDYIAPRTNRPTIAIRLTADNTTADTCPKSLSDVRG